MSPSMLISPKSMHPFIYHFQAVDACKFHRFRMSLRRWTQQGSHEFYPTLLPFPDFLKAVSSLSSCDLCSPADAYGVFSFLHSKGRVPVAHVDQEARCYYFAARNPHLSTAENVVTDIVVPVGTSCAAMSAERLQSIFRQASCLSLREEILLRSFSVRYEAAARQAGPPYLL